MDGPDVIGYFLTLARILFYTRDSCFVCFRVSHTHNIIATVFFFLNLFMRGANIKVQNAKLS